VCGHIFSALEVFSRNALYKFTFYITLHYILQHSTDVTRNNISFTRLFAAVFEIADSLFQMLEVVVTSVLSF